MAHGDYLCCALCDCKVSYSPANDETKTVLCVRCMKYLHSMMIMVYTGAELLAWVKANPGGAKLLLQSAPYHACFYDNELDRTIKELK